MIFVTYCQRVLVLGIRRLGEVECFLNVILNCVRNPSESTFSGSSSSIH